MQFLKTIEFKITSFQIIILGFAGVILLGALLLMLPIATQTNTVTPFNETLFTATSAVCVTGLILVDTASHWSYFGQAIILILIQIGGLGVITVAAIVALLAGRKISLFQRRTLQDAMAAPQVGGLIRLIRFVVLITVIIEGLGILIMTPFFVSRYGAGGIWMAVFHSISAFCNAGFDIMGNKTGHFSSLTYFSAQPVPILTISALIVTGGLGFLTWKDIVKYRLNFDMYRLQSKVILVTTACLIIIPTVFFFLNDFSGMPLTERICSSLFQAITPRTAGFNSVDLTKMSDSGIGILILLMLIGGSPGSTAGGIKTTTLAVLFINSIAVFKKRSNAGCFGRNIPDTAVKNAATVSFLYVVFSLVGAIAISTMEHLPLAKCIFETVSAIATVGLTLGLTPGLHIPSQLILVFLMFFGRVGGLTIIYAAFSSRNPESSKYPIEDIIVG